MTPRVHTNKFRSKARMLTAGIALGLVGTSLVSISAKAASDPAFVVTDSWWVTDVSVPSAQRPAMTQAANGDLLIALNTTGDAIPGGLIQQIRSTNNGATWSAPATIASPTLYGEDGSISSSRGMTTLDNGTILLPYNDAIVHSEHNNRESSLFVAKSTNNGVSYTGTSSPVSLPVSLREAFLGGSQILELPNGTLLLPVWGAKSLNPQWQTEPDRWQTGVLRSTNGGTSWTAYSVIAFDKVNPQQFPPFHSKKYPSGANEVGLKLLPDGRVMAQIRFATGIGTDRAQTYLSYSSNNGTSWTNPVATGRPAEALSMTTAPCTDRLPAGEEKTVLGHRELDGENNRTGRTVVVSSFDKGVTWRGQTVLKSPTGATVLGGASGEPAFHRLSTNELLVVFQGQISGQMRLIANVLQDASTQTDCQDELAAANVAVAATPAIFIEQDSRANWAWPLTTKQFTYSKNTLVSDVIASSALPLSCSPTDNLQLKLFGLSDPLNPSQTLQQAGVTNGAKLVLSGTGMGAGPIDRIGMNELDVNPATMNGANWADNCKPGSTALDYRARSFSLDVGTLSGGQHIKAIELRDSDSSTRLIQSNYKLYSSPDGGTYTLVTGWTFSTSVEGGRLIHRFAGLNSTQRYFKISQTYTDTSYTFVLNNLREDVTVELGP